MMPEEAPRTGTAARKHAAGESQILLPEPYLVFCGDAADSSSLKTAIGLGDWAPNKCVGQYRMNSRTFSPGLPDMTFEEARAAGARSLVIGLATDGGDIPDKWRPCLHEAVEAGLSIVSGMHVSLQNVPGLARHALEKGVTLHDIRYWQPSMNVGTGRKRSGLRLLTVGTDCAVGKKYTALAITRALQSQKRKASFRATGQTGIILSGSGVPVDSVVSDFLSGAVEALSPDNDPDHWDIIEGQGSLFHPAYAAVSLGLLHGSQPDRIVLCHQPGRKQIDGCPGFSLPALSEVIEISLALGRLTNPAVECAGISLNTSHLDDDERQRVLDETEDALGLACFDPLCTGADRLAALLR